MDFRARSAPRLAARAINILASTMLTPTGSWGKAAIKGKAVPPPFARCRSIARSASTLALLAPITVLAQAVPTAPTVADIDANYVDVNSGALTFDLPEATMGEGATAIEIVDHYDVAGWKDNWVGQTTVLRNFGNQPIGVQIGNVNELFGLQNGTYQPRQQDGSSLIFSTDQSYLTFRDRDGKAYRFDNFQLYNGSSVSLCTTIIQQNPPLQNCTYLPSSATLPNGIQYNWTWYVDRLCISTSCSYHWRISKVTTNTGYQIDYSYASNTLSTASVVNWHAKTSTKLTNTLASGTNSKIISYSYPNSTTQNITLPGGGVWAFTIGQVAYNDGSSAQKMTKITPPGGLSPVDITYDGNVDGDFVGTVASVKRDGITTTYTRALNWQTPTLSIDTTITNTAGQTLKVNTDSDLGRPLSRTDGLNRSTTYTYDSIGRLLTETAPEGNKKTYAYDAISNITSYTETPKPGSVLSSISVQSGYPQNCTNYVLCTKPTWSKDAKGNQTDYTYDATTGLITSSTSPQPITGAARPSVTYTYTTSGGVTLVDTISRCRTTTSCAGTSDEIKAHVTYNSNFLPATISFGDSGTTETTSLTYDFSGNVVAEDGPLPGADDVTTYRYDLDRQKIGMVSPDPDGSGPLPRRAIRSTYNAAHQVTQEEVGTVADASDSAWSSFTSRRQVVTGYDSYGRKATEKVTAGGSTYRVTQYSYDTADRLECTVVRMNNATWASLPASACTLQATGAAGPDRIKKYAYDAADQLTKVTAAYGTADQADDRTMLYTGNGKLASVKDAAGNLTGYTYDGLDRLSRVNYPSIATGASTSSGTDFESLTYDVNGNVISHVLRDGISIGYSYDTLNRLVSKDLPGGEPDVSYGYDFLGRQTSIANAVTVTRGYDAFSNLTSESQPFGSMTYQYDLANRRIRSTWWDNFFVTYEYQATGEMTAIRENGTSLLASVAYDDLGRRTQLTFPNSVSTTYTYDGISQLLSKSLDLPGSANDVALGFGYNNAGQVITATNSNNDYAWTGAVNANRDYSVNGLNQYTAAGGVPFTYDARGNLAISGSTTFTYSSENMLQSASGGISLFYDAAGRMIEYDTSASTRFVYDGPVIAAEVDNSSGAIQKRYIFGPEADEALVEYDPSGNRTWLASDERRSVIARTDVNGTRTGLNSYDEYGIPGTTNSGRLQYTGQVWLPELGLYNYKARFYSATLGRFMQTDPLGYSAGMNLYNYTGGDPVNGTDPFGLDKLCQGAPPPGATTPSTTAPPPPPANRECKDDGKGPDAEDTIVVTAWKQRKIRLTGHEQFFAVSPTSIETFDADSAQRCTGSDGEFLAYSVDGAKFKGNTPGHSHPDGSRDETLNTLPVLGPDDGQAAIATGRAYMVSPSGITRVQRYANGSYSARLVYGTFGERDSSVLKKLDLFGKNNGSVQSGGATASARSKNNCKSTSTH